MTYAFTHMGIFSFSYIPHPPPPASRPISQPWGPYPSLEAHIPASRLKSQSQGQNPSLEAQISASRLGFGPWRLDLGLETGIWASRPDFGPWDWDLKGRDRGEEGEGWRGNNLPYVWKHRSSTPLGPLPCFLTTSSKTYLSRAWIPLTISRFCDNYKMKWMYSHLATPKSQDMIVIHHHE